MRMLFAVLLVPALTACSTFHSMFRDSPPPIPYVCNADGLAELVGQQASTQLGGDALRRSGARSIRWLRPGDIVTMEFRQDRLNIHLTADGRVERVVCG